MVRFRRYKSYKKKSPPLTDIEIIEKQISEYKKILNKKSGYKIDLAEITKSIRKTKLFLDKNKSLYEKKKEKINQIQTEIENKGILNKLFNSEQMDNLNKDRIKLRQDISMYEKKLYILSNQENKILTANSDKIEVKRLEVEISNLEFKKNTLIKDKQLKEEQKKQAEIKKKEREETIKAKAAAYDNKTRMRTEILKPKVWKEQLKISNRCPYCNREFEKGYTECDHIMPVSKGGLDRLANLVYICELCNRKKKTMTVFQFCKWANFDFNIVLSKLEKLGKDV
jgi:5-methylcytosine-specific restriction endonuclease McrA